MDIFMKYYKELSNRIELIIAEERENIDKAAELISESLKDENRLLHVFGTGGHSIMACEELFFRAGGLFQIDPIFFSGVAQINGGMKAEIERITGIPPIIMRPHTITKGEVIIISSQAGFNSLTIDAAEESKRLGLFVVGIESKELCNSVPKDCVARHPSGKNLHDIADITIDSKTPYGDAVIEIESAIQKTAPVSNILIFFILNILIARSIEKLIEKGANPPIIMSGNIPGGDEYNKKYEDKYVKLVKYL